MLITYHEMAAMTGVGKPGYPVTLDDLHKAAWALYTGSGKHEVPKGTPRPFVFSADELPSRPGLFLFKIRSAQHFPNSKTLNLEINDGDTLKLTFRFQPVKACFFPPESPNRPPVKKRLTVPDTEYGLFADSRLRNAGLESLSTEYTHEPSRPKNRHHRNKFPPILLCESECVVTDKVVVADYWTRGIAAGRAYGFGMLQM